MRYLQSVTPFRIVISKSSGGITDTSPSRLDVSRMQTSRFSKQTYVERRCARTHSRRLAEAIGVFLISRDRAAGDLGDVTR